MSAFFGLFGNDKNAKAVGIDIGSSAVKVVEIGLKGDYYSLLTYGSLALGPYAGKEIGRAVVLPQEKLVEAITDLLQETKVSSKVAGFTIPLRSSFLRVIEIPPVEEKYLKTVIPIEARKYVPVPIDEVSLGWTVLPPQYNSGDPGKMDVILAAIHNDILNSYTQIASRLNLESKILEIEAFSAMRGMGEAYSVPTLICDIGALSTKIYVVFDGLTWLAHSIGKGSQDITLNLSKVMGLTIEEAELLKRGEGVNSNNADVKSIISLLMQNVFVEIKRVTALFESRRGKKIERIVLSGAGALMPGIEGLWSEEFKLPVDKSEPFKQIDTLEVLKKALQEAGPEFAGAMGVAMGALGAH